MKENYIVVLFIFGVSIITTIIIVVLSIITEKLTSNSNTKLKTIKKYKGIARSKMRYRSYNELTLMKSKYLTFDTYTFGSSLKGIKIPIENYIAKYRLRRYRVDKALALIDKELSILEGCYKQWIYYF